MDDSRETTNVVKTGSHRNAVLEEYSDVIETLTEDLDKCTAEQKHLRSELEALRDESKKTCEIAKKSFSSLHFEECEEERGNERAKIANLEERIAICQMEKDTVFQLWQMALKAIDVLEGELKSSSGSKPIEDEGSRGIRESYSEAIRILESKLQKTQENFARQQSLWESSKEKMEMMSKEKNELMEKTIKLEEGFLEKERNYVKILESLREELETKRIECNEMLNLNKDLEENLLESKKIIASLSFKENEAKKKVLEAVELVESAVREKDLALGREVSLESKLATLSEELNAKYREELAKVREVFEKDVKKYLLEIKELRSEVREKDTMLDRVERERRLVEEELEKIRHGSEDFIEKSSKKIFEAEEKLRNAETKYQNSEECLRKRYESKIRTLEEKMRELEDNLTNSNDRLRKIQMDSLKNSEDRIREADERTREAVERYSNLERRLAKVLDDRENVTTLRMNFETELERRDQEKMLLQSKVRELQEDLRMANHRLEECSARSNLLLEQVRFFEREEMKRRHFENENVSIIEERSRNELAEKLLKLQEKFDKKTKDLSEHVEIHRKLGQRWKDEAKLLAFKFQKRSKELREKINTLRKENEDLSNQLLNCKEELARCRGGDFFSGNLGVERR